MADDQAINLEVMKSSLKEFNLLKKCSFAINGQEAVDQVTRTIDSLEDSILDSSKPFRPVELMILDLQMPILNGLDVIKKVKQIYERLRVSHPESQIEKPTFIFVTAFCSKSLREYTKDQDVFGVFEKPMSQDDLKNVLLEVQKRSETTLN